MNWVRNSILTATLTVSLGYSFISVGDIGSSKNTVRPVGPSRPSAPTAAAKTRELRSAHNKNRTTDDNKNSKITSDNKDNCDSKILMDEKGDYCEVESPSSDKSTPLKPTTPKASSGQPASAASSTPAVPAQPGTASSESGTDTFDVSLSDQKVVKVKIVKTDENDNFEFEADQFGCAAGTCSKMNLKGQAKGLQAQQAQASAILKNLYAQMPQAQVVVKAETPAEKRAREEKERKAKLDAEKQKRDNKEDMATCRKSETLDAETQRPKKWTELVPDDGTYTKVERREKIDTLRNACYADKLPDLLVSKSTRATALSIYYKLRDKYADLYASSHVGLSKDTDDMDDDDKDSIKSGLLESYESIIDGLKDRDIPPALALGFEAAARAKFIAQTGQEINDNFNQVTVAASQGNIQRANALLHENDLKMRSLGQTYGQFDIIRSRYQASLTQAGIQSSNSSDEMILNLGTTCDGVPSNLNTCYNRRRQEISTEIMATNIRNANSPNRRDLMNSSLTNPLDFMGASTGGLTSGVFSGNNGLPYRLNYANDGEIYDNGVYRGSDYIQSLLGSYRNIQLGGTVTNIPGMGTGISGLITGAPPANIGGNINLGTPTRASYLGRIAT